MNNGTILVIDDEPQIRKLLEISLVSNKYKVLEADNGKMGILLAANHNPDLILLDIQLPDTNGHEVLKELKCWYNNSIIMLSVVNTEQDIVQALDAGATDYLCKPFRNAELLARIRNALKKNYHTSNESVLTFGNLTIDIKGRLVKKGNEIVKLTNTEYNLLLLLVKNEGRVLTQKFILKEIWGIGAQTEAQYLRVFVGTLRKKIENDPAKPAHIITESGIGYRFQ